MKILSCIILLCLALPPSGQNIWITSQAQVEDRGGQMTQDKPGELFVYPVPSTGEVIVNNAFIKDANRGYCITNLLGKEVKMGLIQSEAQRIDLSNVSAGLYYFVLTEDGKPVQVRKIIIQN